MAARPLRTALTLMLGASLLAAAPASARTEAEAAPASACVPPDAPKCVAVKVNLPEILPGLPEVPEVPEVPELPELPEVPEPSGCVAIPELRERCEGWAARFDMEDGSDVPRDLVVSPDGSRAFVTGSNWPGVEDGRPDFAVHAVDVATGTQAWTLRHEFGEPGDDIATSLAMRPDGKVLYVAGSEGPANLPRDAALLAVDTADGSILWQATFNGPRPNSPDGLSDVVVSPDGERVFATGYSYGGRLFSLDYLTLAYDASTGELLWSARHAGGAGGADWALAAEITPDGSRVVVSGYEGQADLTTDALTQAYDAGTGELLWEHWYDASGGFDWGMELAVAPDGTAFYAAQWSEAPGTHRDYAVHAIDAATGEARWTTRIAGDGGSTADIAEDIPTGIVATADGVIVTGYAFGPAGDSNLVAPEALTVALDGATGAERWADPYEGLGPGTDYGADIALSADGATAYVTGASQTSVDPGETLPGTAPDFVTLAYSVDDGSRVWTSRYDGGLDDQGVAAAALPGGGLVVAGASLSPTEGYDYLTVRYTA